MGRRECGQMALTEKNIRNIFIYAAPKFISYGLNLITLPILTRLLTPHEFGVIALACLFPAIAVSVFSCGITASAQRYYFEYRHHNDKFISFVFSLQVFLYVSLLASSLGVYFLKDTISGLIMGKRDFGFAVFVTFVAGYLGQIASFYLILYQNMEKAVVHSTFTVLQAFITTAAGLILVWYFKLSYMGIIYGSLLGTCTVCLAMMLHFNRNLRFALNSRILWDNIKYGLQVVPKSFSGFINRFFDKYMLNNILSLSAVGVYNIGQTVGNTMFFLMSTVWSSFQPVCYREVFDKGAESSASVGRLFTIFAYISLFPVLLLILFAQELVYIIAPPSYYEAIDIIIIISGGVATQVFGMYVGVQYAYSKKAYWIFPVTVIGTFANVMANIILIPKLGLIGAGLSTVISTCIVNSILTFIGQKLYRIHYEWRTIAVLYAIIMFAIISVLYLRTIEFNGIYLYLIKLAFVAAFVYTGMKVRLITRDSIGKVSKSLFNYSKVKEA